MKEPEKISDIINKQDIHNHESASLDNSEKNFGLNGRKEKKRVTQCPHLDSKHYAKVIRF
jgi:hypothetical protein